MLRCPVGRQRWRTLVSSHLNPLARRKIQQINNKNTKVFRQKFKITLCTRHIISLQAQKLILYLLSSFLFINNSEIYSSI